MCIGVLWLYETQMDFASVECFYEERFKWEVNKENTVDEFH